VVEILDKMNSGSITACLVFLGSLLSQLGLLQHRRPQKPHGLVVIGNVQANLPPSPCYPFYVVQCSEV